MTTETIRSGVSYDSVALAVEGNRFSRDRVSDFSTQSADLLQFYASLLGDLPYPRSRSPCRTAGLPGGHSPAYFAVLNQPRSGPARADADMAH